jgi:hypothetical protein
MAATSRCAAVTVGTFTIAGVQLSWIPVAQSPDAGLAVLTFVVPLQMVSFITASW